MGGTFKWEIYKNVKKNKIGRLCWEICEKKKNCPTLLHSPLLSYYIYTNINDYTLLKYKLIPRYALLIYCFLRQSNRKGAGIGRYIFLYILKFMNTVKYTLN